MHRILLATSLALPSLVSAQVQFQEVGKHHLPRDRPTVHGPHSVAIGDVDGDGDPDVVIASRNERNRLYINDGGGVFVDVSETRMPPAERPSHGVALGDADGDGDLDVVVGNAGQQDQLLLNDGRGWFTEATLGRMPSDTVATTSIVFVDVDRDTDQDLILGSTNGRVPADRQTRLYVNDGTGRFTDETVSRLPVDSDITAAVASADVDGDGDPDLIIGNGAGVVRRQDRLYLNDGRGRFTDETASRMPVGDFRTNAILFGDVDGDGAPDLYVGVHDAQDRLYLNDGAGVFLDRTTERLPIREDSTAAVAFADVDDDGDVDVVLGTGSYAGVTAEDRLYLNDGRGSFAVAPRAQLPVAPQRSLALGIADVDGDGDADALFVRDSVVPTTANELWFNDRAGTFVNGSQRDFPPFDGAISFVLVDVDGDRDLDVVAATGVHPDRLFVNDGRGSFVDVTGTRMPSTRTRAVAIEFGDLDGDGDPDLVVGASTGDDRIYENDGGGVFTDVSASSLPFNSRRTSCVDVGDADGDGDLDLVLGSIPNGGQTRLYLNDGDGVFTDATSQRMPLDNEATNTIAFADVDNDADLDIVIANAFRPMQLYLNDGSGHFTDGTVGRIAPRSERRTSMVLVDVDGDRDLDVVVATGQFGSDRLLLNDGTGVFSDAPSGRLPDLPTPTYRVAVHDFDEDGDPDLFFGKSGSRDSVLCLNDGTGTFSVTTRLPSGGRDLTHALFGDVDGDFDLDMVVQARRVLRNLGRQVVIPHLARQGRGFRIDAYARYGPDRWADVVFPLVSDVPASIPVPPFGVVGVDPSRSFALPAISIPRHIGSVSTSFAIPATPAVVGVRIHVQALLAQLPHVFRLTNTTADVVIR